MKRSFAFFALVCAILFGCAATADAQSKALKKDVKKRVKELTKEGWKPLASSSTLEYAFSKYRTYLEEDPENRTSLVRITTFFCIAVCQRLPDRNTVCHAAVQISMSVYYQRF